jgi:uncharacterized protein YjbJ (UPF0337 family)
MNWDRVEGNWKQFTGKVKEQWGKLTDDDITQINGNREQLEGKIQAKYGYAKTRPSRKWMSGATVCKHGALLPGSQFYFPRASSCPRAFLADTTRKAYRIA